MKIIPQENIRVDSGSLLSHAVDDLELRNVLR